MKPYWRRLPAFLFILVSACGGGGGNDGKSLTLPAVFDRTGVASDGGGVQQASTSNGTSTGDGPANEAYRGFISINLASVPGGAQVDSALLRVITGTILGNPFGELGALTVDHVNLGAGLDAADYSAGALTPGFATIPPFVTGVVVTVDVTNAVRADLAAGRPVSSFRLRFAGAPSFDNSSDVVLTDCVVGDPARQPVITLSYD